MADTIKNKIADSGIITIDLAAYQPEGAFVAFDIKDYLFMEMILKEKDFREKINSLNRDPYQNKNVGIVCSADAIIPMWAYMLVVACLQPVCHFVAVGDDEEIKKRIWIDNLRKINPQDYRDARVVIKGCGDLQIAEYLYAEITNILLPVVKSIMYGEPCSTVPVYKRK